jgi:hypothetical protein
MVEPVANGSGTAASIELGWNAGETLRVGCGVALPVTPLLNPRVVDCAGNTIARAELEWHSSDARVARFGEGGGNLIACAKGTTHIWASVKNKAPHASAHPGTNGAVRTTPHEMEGELVASAKIEVEVWAVDHVLLTPRSLEIPLGLRKQIIAEVTSDEGLRATNVLLNWKQETADSLTVRIQPRGWITANRLGYAAVTAGAGDPLKGGVWARIPTSVSVIPSPDELQRGSGFPELRLTDRDTDPATGEIRQGDPEQPALWQEVSDYQSNLWWLNLQSPDAAFFFAQRGEDIRLWRAFHVQKVVDMVLQVHMREEFDARGESERPDLWARHKVILDLKEVQLKQAMWDKLQTYVNFGGGLD